MRGHALRIAVVGFLAVAAACGGDAPRAQRSQTPSPGPALTLLSAKPVVGPGGGRTYTNPGAVVRSGGRFHMFRNSFDDFPGPSDVTYLVSDDGLTWTEGAPKPVFTSRQVPYAGENTAFFMTAYEENGTWVAFFYTYAGRVDPGHIGRATARSPAGPWRADPAPVLSPGPEGAWDAARVGEPSIVRTASGFRLYYSGMDAAGGTRIGLATSADGSRWVKHNDPSTAGEFVQSDPVLSPSLSWEGTHLRDPHVVADGTGFLMVYDTRAAFKIGVARSPDGLRWTRAEQPVLTREDVPGEEQIWQSALSGNDSGLLFWLEIGSKTTNIYAYRLTVPAS